MLQLVNRETYDRVKAAIPQHASRVLENRHSGSIYYTSQMVFDTQGNLVAMHADNGQHYADTNLLRD